MSYLGMFNSKEGYSLSDVAAVTKDSDGFMKRMDDNMYEPGQIQEHQHGANSVSFFTGLNTFRQLPFQERNHCKAEHHAHKRKERDAG